MKRLVVSHLKSPTTWMGSTTPWLGGGVAGRGSGHGLVTPVVSKSEVKTSSSDSMGTSSERKIPDAINASISALAALQVRCASLHTCGASQKSELAATAWVYAVKGNYPHVPSIVNAEPEIIIARFLVRNLNSAANGGIRLSGGDRSGNTARSRTDFKLVKHRQCDREADHCKAQSANDFHHLRKAYQILNQMRSWR